MGVQAEVKKFLRDPNRGRPKPQLFETAHTEDDEIEVVERERSYIEMERHGEDGEDGTSGEVRGMRRRGRRLQESKEAYFVALRRKAEVEKGEEERDNTTTEN